MTTYTTRPEPGPRTGWLVCKLVAGGFWAPVKRFEKREEAVAEELRLRQEAVKSWRKARRG